MKGISRQLTSFSHNEQIFRLLLKISVWEGYIWECDISCRFHRGTNKIHYYYLPCLFRICTDTSKRDCHCHKCLWLNLAWPKHSVRKVTWNLESGFTCHTYTNSNCTYIISKTFWNGFQLGTFNSESSADIFHLSMVLIPPLTSRTRSQIAAIFHPSIPSPFRECCWLHSKIRCRVARSSVGLPPPSLSNWESQCQK